MNASRAIMLLLVMFMVACTNSGTSTTDLTNRQWQLIEIDGQPPLHSEHALTIVFDATGRVNGFSGCNSFSGDYRINGATITLSNVMTTLMACADDAVTAQEIMFHQALQAVTQYELNAGTLVLRDENGAVRLRFQAF
ncbi:META domain-containing protein [Chloroflexus sp.]|uniref:META domain-containing protein n=1 Tax=Chloroflexus sp. TaxID=1904827 RepID=UPI002ADE0BF1|nr:META domain-containing protein [Chloroflexus sp.]